MGEFNMEKRRNLRGQMFSTELMFSLSVFIAALIVFLFVWNNMYNNYQEEQSDTKMQVVLIGVSDAAVMSMGDPQDWEIGVENQANSYGFASARNVLSPAKLYAMQGYFAANYSDMVSKMGAGGYDFFAEVRGMDDSVLYSFGSKADPANQSISSVSAERLALIGEDIVKLRVQLWRVKGRSI
jgi:hypothetical protein